MADIQSLLSDITQLPGQPGRNEDVDDVFVETLRRLVRSYMRHTDRPFPLKYVIDLS
jgi:putative aminopeptidase FrvX